MLPHIGRNCGGQSVECERLQTVEPADRTRELRTYAEGHLKRVHLLHHGAQLDAAIERAPTKDLVSREHSIRLPLVTVLDREHLVNLGEVGRVARQPVGDGAPLEAHRVVHAVVIHRPVGHILLRELVRERAVLSVVPFPVPALPECELRGLVEHTLLCVGHAHVGRPLT